MLRIPQRTSKTFVMLEVLLDYLMKVAFVRDMEEDMDNVIFNML